MYKWSDVLSIIDPQAMMLHGGGVGRLEAQLCDGDYWSELWEPGKELVAVSYRGEAICNEDDGRLAFEPKSGPGRRTRYLLQEEDANSAVVRRLSLPNKNLFDTLDLYERFGRAGAEETNTVTVLVVGLVSEELAEKSEKAGEVNLSRWCETRRARG